MGCVIAFLSHLGYEDHISRQTRDWNKELQTTHELAQKHLLERLVHERTLFKVFSDFVVAATRGAMSAIDGNIMVINPGKDTKSVLIIFSFVKLFLVVVLQIYCHFCWFEFKATL